MSRRELYEFGPFRIDVALSRLERGGEPIPLPPRAFDLLLLLARNPDRVMGKGELMATLWPDTFVEEANLTQHVYTLRKALGDQPTGHPYIDTVPRRGYRLAAVVREVGPDPATRAHLSPDAMVAEGEVRRDGERKRATVMDVRISNAAAVIERLGPEALEALALGVLTLAAEEVERFEGVLTERRHDGFVAVFGAAIVHEDDPRRAALAALAIERRFQSLPPVHESDDDGQRVALQIGISTGSIVVTRGTTDGVARYSAVGDAATTANVLQQLAGAGTILVGESTRRELEDDIEVAATGMAAGGAAAYRVVRRSGARGVRPARLSRTLAAFVGRRHELAQLIELAAQARSGRGQVVGIVGEPGIGKSRLLHELGRELAAAGPLPLLEGRCVSYGTLIPYLPLADLIRAHCEVTDADPPAAIRHAVEQAVERNGLPRDAGTWLLRLIGVVDPGSALEALSPEAIKARTFDALRTLLLQAAARGPLVIVVEDIHWIDRTSEEFLASLVERLIATPIVMVATYRPGYRPPWADKSYASQIALKPLTSDDSARLMDSLASEDSPARAMSAAILEKAEGNPFFLEELARTVVERGPDAQHIPDTVQGVIMARLDRLPAAAKQVLQTASVIGREVPRPLLARMWRGGDFTGELATLCRLEFLYERLAGDEITLVFKHALTQDVAYDSLLARSRRELHLLAAQGLVDVYGERDDLAAKFAYHYAKTDLIDEAVHWLTRAAEQAARVYANSEAILHLDLAARKLRRLPEGRDRDRRMLEVALRFAHSLYFLGRFRESVEVLLPHEAALARVNDPSLSASYSFWLAHMYSRLGDQRRAAESAGRAIEAATTAGDDGTLGKAHGLLALEGHWAGTPVEGVDHGRRAVQLLARCPEHRWWLGMAHFYLATNHLLTGDFAEALAEAELARSVGKEIGDPRLQTYAGYTTAWTEASRGNVDAAARVGRASLELAPDRVSRAYATLFLGYALLEGQGHHEAEALLAPLLPELEGFSFPQWQGLAYALLGDARRRQGALDDAAALAERGLRVTMSARYWYGVGHSHRVAGRIALDRRETGQALVGLQEAIGVFDRIGARFEAARTRLELAGTASAAGERDRARDAAAAACRALERMDAPAYAARAAQLAADLRLAC